MIVLDNIELLVAKEHEEPVPECKMRITRRIVGIAVSCTIGPQVIQVLLPHIGIQCQVILAIWLSFLTLAIRGTVTPAMGTVCILLAKCRFCCAPSIVTSFKGFVINRVDP